MDTKTIAIIDDDVSIGDMLEETLRQEGYRTLRAWSGTEALYLLSQNHPDLILLDLMLPGLNGEEVLPHIQGIPVIVLSAKGDIQDKVSLLRGGAADYMTKPFDIRELLARIAVQLRNTVSPLAPVYRAGDLAVDTASRQVLVRGAEVRLTRTEYAILKLLIQNPGQAIAKGVILDRISEDTPDCTDSSLKQHISNLRRKLKETGYHDYIESVWGIGFRLSCK
ncbi:MAG: response regulator transcription factor [Lachnospiraceae bacterium]|nr:response regulator transcription factor [Lachnospiraceae bacterium]